MNKNDISVNIHYDPDIAILYMKKGRGILRVEGNSYPVSDGYIIITNPYEIHRYEIDEGVYQERIVLYVNPSLLRGFDADFDELFDFFSNRPRGVGNIFSADAVKQYKLDLLLEALVILAKQKTKKSDLLCQCKVIEILCALRDAYDKKSDEPIDIRSQNKTVLHAIEYINSNLTEVNIEKIAKELYLSKSRAEHLFKDSTGVALGDYIILRRLIACNGYIENGSTVKEAAYQSGFCNYSNFYRLYKRHMGMTPAEYKAKCKEV